jgi:hypothetical protein
LIVTSPPSPAAAFAAPTKASVQAQSVVLTGIQAVPNGIRITFMGGAGLIYQIERAVTLQNGGVWTNIGSATTDGAGQGEFTDNDPPPTRVYYRTVSP